MLATPPDPCVPASCKPLITQYISWEPEALGRGLPVIWPLTTTSWTPDSFPLPPSLPSSLRESPMSGGCQASPCPPFPCLSSCLGLCSQKLLCPGPVPKTVLPTHLGFSHLLTQLYFFLKLINIGHWSVYLFVMELLPLLEPESLSSFEIPIFLPVPNR